MFSIFSDRNFLADATTPHTAILIPFWGKNPEPANDPENGRFDRYAEVGGSLLRLTPLSDCDVGVFPQNWETAGDRADELGEAFNSLCRAAGKTPVFFSGTDSTEPLPLDGVAFRTSLLRSRRLPNEFALPAWSEDFLERYLAGQLRTRIKPRRPVVGFCGNTMGGLPTPPPDSKLRRLLGRKPPPPTSTLDGDHPRTLALQAVESDRRLQPNFVLRDGFWGHEGAGGRAEQRRRYVENMLESDYVLCARGIGNFSYRLYETLSLGRIPIFVDTDCVLPLEGEINWRDYCVWVDEADIRRIGDRVIEFHESLDEAEFDERQHACRSLWETHISPQGFFSLFHRHFD